MSSSHGGILAPEEEPTLQNGDTQLTGHGLLCLLLIIGLFVNLLVGCSDSSAMRLGRLYVELQFYCAVFNFGQQFISFGIFGVGQTLEDIHRPCVLCGLPTVWPIHIAQATTMCKYGVERWERKRTDLSTMKRKSGDMRVERNSQM